MGRPDRRAWLLAVGAGLLPAAGLAAQQAPKAGPGMPDAWRAAVYSFRAESGEERVLELLQLLPREAPVQGRFVRVRTDRARGQYRREEGRYRIDGARLILHLQGESGETVERARYYGTLICFDGPDGPRAYRFVRPPDRRSPPPPWPSRQGRPPAGC